MLLFLILIMFSNSLFSQNNNLNTLDELALKYGTDKSSKHHNYTETYDNYFSKFRSEKINFLEIGFFKGASAHMWQDYFSQASLYFIDIDKNLYNKFGKNLSSRCSFYKVDQSKKEQLLTFKNQVNTEFDIIIDDGGHTMEQQLLSFEILFPALKKGGLYIIEDLHTSYWKKYQGHGTMDHPEAGPNTTIDFLFNLIHQINYIGARTGCADQKKCPDSIYKKLSIYQKDIKSIYFYSSLCIIEKNI